VGASYSPLTCLFCYDLVTLERERDQKSGGVGVKGLQVTFVTLSQNGQELCTKEKFLRVNEIAKLCSQEG
jgi:hypothetical protein